MAWIGESEWWERYKTYLQEREGLALTDPWDARMEKAYLSGLNDGYDRGYEDGRDLAWRKVQQRGEESYNRPAPSGKKGARRA